MPSFADEMAASFPPQVALPDEMRLTLDWLEANGCVRTYTQTKTRYASLFVPAVEGNTLSTVTFNPVDPTHVHHWGQIDDLSAQRLAPFIRTGGDGSYAALWRDDSGAQKFVHLGSGSGSVMACVLVDNPIDMLRLMAIGYDELCWHENYAMTPAEVAADNEYADPYVAPRAFRTFVETTFKVTIPRTAAQIVPHPTDMGDTSDPFWRWIESKQGTKQ